MRSPAYAAVALATLVLAACGGDETADPVWSGPPDPEESGVVSVERFASFQEDVDEPWERSPSLAAGEFLRLDVRRADRTTIDAIATQEGAGPQTVAVTLDGLADDSVKAERWTLTFEPKDDGTYELTSALRELQCQPDRGHQRFAPAPCI